MNQVFYSPPKWYKLSVDIRDGCRNQDVTVIYNWLEGDSSATRFTLDLSATSAPVGNLKTTQNHIYAKFKSFSGSQAMNDVSVAKVHFLYRNEYGDTVPFNNCGNSGIPKPDDDLDQFICGKNFIADYYCVPPGAGLTCPSDNPPSSCPYLYAWDGTDYRLVNNVLAQSEDPAYASQTRADFLVLPNLISVPGDAIRLEIREEADEITSLDAIGASALIVPSSFGRVGFTDHGRFITLRDEILPTAAVTGDGEDVLSRLLNSDTSRFTSTGPGWLEVEYTFGVAAAGKPIAGKIRTGAPPGSVGGLDPDKDAVNKPVAAGDVVANIITVQYRAGDGTWSDVARLVPRVAENDTRVEFTDGNVPDPLRLRIEWTTGISLNYLPYITGEPVDIVPAPLALQSALHSATGDVQTAVEAVDGDTALIAPGDKLSLRFAKPVVEPGQTALLVLKASGQYRRAGDSVWYPIGFGFDQNYPNPFNPTTSFRFSLPTATHVSLEIYNILGQRVATVVDRGYPAGRHSVEWNSKADNGEPVGSGVYFARLTVGDRTATRKMMVVK